MINLYINHVPNLHIPDLIWSEDIEKGSAPSIKELWQRAESHPWREGAKMCDYEEFKKEYPMAMHAVFNKHRWDY